MINADFNWTVTTPGGTAFDIFVMGRNLADEEARKHTSFVKDTVAVAGTKHFGRVPHSLLIRLPARSARTSDTSAGAGIDLIR